MYGALPFSSLYVRAAFVCDLYCFRIWEVCTSYRALLCLPPYLPSCNPTSPASTHTFQPTLHCPDLHLSPSTLFLCPTS